MQREDNLTGLHANTQFPKFIGAARQYELTGDDRSRRPRSSSGTPSSTNDPMSSAATATARFHAQGEAFHRPSGPARPETCNTYNMLKLTRHLFCWDPQAEYADYYERALYNHILASQNPENGHDVLLRAVEDRLRQGPMNPRASARRRLASGAASGTGHREPCQVWRQHLFS